MSFLDQIEAQGYGKWGGSVLGMAAGFSYGGLWGAIVGGILGVIAGGIGDSFFKGSSLGSLGGGDDALSIPKNQPTMSRGQEKQISHGGVGEIDTSKHHKNTNEYSQNDISLDGNSGIPSHPASQGQQR